MGQLAVGLATVLDLILNMIQLLIIASVIISWVGADPNNQLVRMIHSLTEPMYRPIRKFTSGLGGLIDWAPMILILIVIFLQVGVVPLIRTL